MNPFTLKENTILTQFIYAIQLNNITFIDSILAMGTAEKMDLSPGGRIFEKLNRRNKRWKWPGVLGVLARPVKSLDHRFNKLRLLCTFWQWLALL